MPLSSDELNARVATISRYHDYLTENLKGSVNKVFIRKTSKQLYEQAETTHFSHYLRSQLIPAIVTKFRENNEGVTFSDEEIGDMMGIKGPHSPSVVQHSISRWGPAYTNFYQYTPLEPLSPLVGASSSSTP